jgi:hypothetical protein
MDNKHERIVALRKMRIISLLLLAACSMHCALGQGTLRADLYPYAPSFPPLGGFAVVYVPSLDGVDENTPLVVSYSITVNSTNILFGPFSQARIAGGSTAWAWVLNSPERQELGTIFTGTTEMITFQIRDMLAGVTTFEFVNGDMDYLRGPLVVVPEPCCVVIFGIGLIAFFVLGRGKRT